MGWDDLLAWVSLGRAPELTLPALSAALELLGSPSAVVGASPAEQRRAAMSPAAAAFLSSPASRPGAAERRWLAEPHHELVPFTDPRYPALLRTLPDGPLVLYVSGRVDALANPQLAVVGSRNPSPQGREIAADFAERLSERGLAITSGLAEGIDVEKRIRAVDEERAKYLQQNWGKYWLNPHLYDLCLPAVKADPLFHSALVPVWRDRVIADPRSFSHA